MALTGSANPDRSLLDRPDVAVVAAIGSGDQEAGVSKIKKMGVH